MTIAAEAATDVEPQDYQERAAKADLNLAEKLLAQAAGGACCEGGRMPSEPLGNSEQFAKCEPRLAGVLDELARMSNSKGTDYANDSDEYSNMRAAGEWGLPDYQLCFMRIDEKMRRIKNFCQRGYLMNESLEDSAKDIALLACIGTILFREAEGNGTARRPEKQTAS